MQTVLPLIHCFGKGLCADGIETLVRIGITVNTVSLWWIFVLFGQCLTLFFIGGLLGESFIVKQILPLLRNVILLCIDSSKVIKPEPQHIWNSFALIDGLSALEGLVSVLPVKAVLRELLQVFWRMNKYNRWWKWIYAEFWSSAILESLFSVVSTDWIQISLFMHYFSDH